MESYRSLSAWQAGHRLCIETLRTLDATYHPPAQAVFDRLRRAVVSVETNIVEGYVVGAGDDFRGRIRTALGHAAEAEALLDITGELCYLPETQLRPLRHAAGNTVTALYRLLRSLSPALKVSEPAPTLPRPG